MAPGEGISDGIARLSTLLAKPAEAEGVSAPVVAYRSSETGELYLEGYGLKDPDCLVLQEDHLFALSAVTAERDRLREDRDSHQRACIAEMDKVRQLRAEVEGLRKDAERKGMRIKELDLLFGRYLLAMKAALIDADYRGGEEGMRWIYNSLAGPGELPPENESDAQAFFDREIKAVNDGMAEVLAWHKAERDAAMAAKEE